uniref:Ninein-like n=1 Tax=Amphilophus citrinellus TaxID=61819 RepID=A0A3Q0SJT2_AMPCI
MEEAEHSRYVSQLKVEFDSCDTTATGFLDREELTALCRKLQLEAHLPLLLSTLLGEQHYGRVNFEEFKEGFVAVLSRSLDFSTSEDDSSYLEPAVPEQVKPKFVKGSKRYGRRSKPDAALTCDSEESPPSRAEASDSSPSGQQAFLRTLESGRSLSVFRSSMQPPAVSEERSARCTSPSLLTAAAGQRVLSRLDDGSGCTSPERVMALWTEEGIRNSRDILQVSTLDFPLEERLSLADLTLALDNELLVSDAVQLLSRALCRFVFRELAEQARRERDKAKADLDLADHRNLQLVREVDDRHASMETLNQSRIRDLEQDFRDRLTALRCETEQESEALLQQVEAERGALQEELQLLRAQEAELQEELHSAVQVWYILHLLTQIPHQADFDWSLSSWCPALSPSALCSLDDDPGPAVSIQTELALEQLKQKHNEELQQLNIRLETQMNYYERSLEKMRESMEVERKDISQAFKVRKVFTPVAPETGRNEGPILHLEAFRESRSSTQNVSSVLTFIYSNISAFIPHVPTYIPTFISNIPLLSDLILLFPHRPHSSFHSFHSTSGKSWSGGFWERRLVQSEQEKLCSEQMAREEKRRMEEQRHEEVRLLKEQISSLQGVVQTSSQLEASLKEDLEASRGRSSELEARLEEACVQLEDSIAFLESHELVNKRLASEKNSVEEELRLAKSREEELVVQVSHMKAELEELQAASDSLLQDREEVAGNCSRLSSAVAQQQAQLQAREHAVSSLRAEVENLQEVLRLKAESVSRLMAELDSLKTDRARLIQDLKEQAMAVDNLQLQLDGVSEELDRRRSSEECLQEALKQEQARTSQLRSSLPEISVFLCVCVQDQYEKAMAALQQRMEDLETKLKGVRLVLQEKVQQLKEQLAKNTKSSALLKDLYLENSQLMKALQVTEQRQKRAEKKNFLLEEKIGALNKLLREIVPASLAT